MKRDKSKWDGECGAGLDGPTDRLKSLFRNERPKEIRLVSEGISVTLDDGTTIELYPNNVVISAGEGDEMVDATIFGQPHSPHYGYGTLTPEFAVILAKLGYDLRHLYGVPVERSK